MHRLLVLSVLCLLASLLARDAVAQPIIDGKIDALYGSPVASDPGADANGNAPMDLRDLHLWSDASHLYVAFSIDADVTKSTTNWGKYVLYIDTTNDSSGATSDAWQRNVTVADPHKPEYSVNTWVDQAPYNATRVQMFKWSGASWLSHGGVAEAALASNGISSVIEWKVPLVYLGQPKQIWVEVWATGGAAKDNAQDTINSPANDWTATNWTAQAQLKVSTAYTLATVSVDAGVKADAGVAKDMGVVVADKGTPKSDAPMAKDSAVTSDIGSQRDVGAAGDAAGAAADSGGGKDARPDARRVDAGSQTTTRKEGCGCAASGNAAAPSTLALAVLLLAGAHRRRRR